MPAPDSCHEQVVRALKNDGWTIEQQQSRVRTRRRRRVSHIYVDIVATRTGANGQTETIYVEVKCFSQKRRDTTEVYTALGQYLIYRKRLQQSFPDANLVLAIP